MAYGETVSPIYGQHLTDILKEDFLHLVSVDAIYGDIGQ